MLACGQLAETAERFFAFQRHPGSIPAEVPEYNQSAKARDQVNQMIVEPFFL